MALPAEHEEMDGGSTFLYLILADGSAHEVGNMGNTYLFGMLLTAPCSQCVDHICRYLMYSRVFITS